MREAVMSQKTMMKGMRKMFKRGIAWGNSQFLNKVQPISGHWVKTNKEE